VGDGVGVPSLGQHRDRNDAADRLAEAAGLADRVHHLAQQRFVVERFGADPREPLAQLATKRLDLACGNLLELGAETLAAVDLLAVDEKRTRSIEPLAVVPDIAEQGQRALLQLRDLAFRHLVAGDVVVDEL
jgi:hypothetical protein